MKWFFDLIKFGIVVFVLLTAGASYFLAMEPTAPLVPLDFLLFNVALLLLSAGIFTLNQWQEHKIDQKMPRTKGRPIPSGIISPLSALVLASSMTAAGLALCYCVSLQMFVYGFATFAMYNGFYTMYWKPRMAFGAVPGALPGAMPILMGYAAHDLWYRVDAIYLFILMFLWQMPHFWALAIKYEDDYKAANIPVLPAVIGRERTLYHMGLYVFAYAAWACMAPWFVHVWFGYLLVILPFVVVVTWSFLNYFKKLDQKSWLGFFLWTTFSVIVFVFIPVIDKWGSLIFSTRI